MGKYYQEKDDDRALLMYAKCNVDYTPRVAVEMFGAHLKEIDRYMDELYFDAPTLSTMFAEPSFVLHNVTIGVNFHWERKEVQKFAGALKVIVSNGKLVAINVVGVEDYLLSVISSEMSATADEEFLKAHAVISRSWVMAQLSSAKHASAAALTEIKHEQNISGDAVFEYTKWYDKDDHDLFDVCADDHCQRYQGLTRAVGSKVRKVIDATWGQVLKYDGCLCDARFSKCCGGRMEKFSVCWDASSPAILEYSS